MLHKAVYRNNESLLKGLLGDPSYDVNAVNTNGRTPLHLAAKDGRKDMVEMLLNKGAKVDIADSRSRTPLHLAAVNGHKEVVEALLKEEGIDVGVVDEDGKTPFDLATDDKIKTLLQNAEKSDPVDESSTNSEGVQEEEEEDDDDDVVVVAPTEPAQTEEQPSSFFGSLFSILMKPFSLIGSFFGGFFSWLFGSDQTTGQEPLSNSVGDESSTKPDQTTMQESRSNLYQLQLLTEQIRHITNLLKEILCKTHDKHA